MGLIFQIPHLALSHQQKTNGYLALETFSNYSRSSAFCHLNMVGPEVTHIACPHLPGFRP